MNVRTATAIMLTEHRNSVDDITRERAIGRMYDMDSLEEAPGWVQAMIRELDAGRPFPAPVR